MPRLTIDVAKEFDETVARLAKAKGTSKAEVIRDAVASYSYLKSQVSADQDKKVSITQGDKVLQDVILP